MRTHKPLSLRAFTIIESMLVLVVLVVFSMVMVGLFLHKPKTPGTTKMIQEAEMKGDIEKPGVRNYRFSPKAP
jgi:competence protein ComGF